MTYLGDADGELSMDQLRYHGLLSTTKPERNTMTLTYDPDYDNCAGMPGCGGERVLFTWYREPAACCPRCYENIFGAPPEPGTVVKIPVTA